MSTTIQQILTKAVGPYDKPIRCKVVAVDNAVSYQNSSGQQKIRRDLILADESGIVRCRNYDPSKDNILSLGTSVIVKNYITRAYGVFRMVITTATKVFKTKEVKCVDDAEEQAHIALNPPPAAYVALKDVRKSPLKSLISIKGQIVQEEMTTTVMAHDKPSPVKGLVIEQEKIKCRLSLWRGFSDFDVKTGDFITATNVIVGAWNKDVSLSTTDATKLETVEMQEKDHIGEVAGVEQKQDECILLLKLEEDFEEFKVPHSILSEPDSLVGQTLHVTARGTDVCSLTLQS